MNNINFSVYAVRDSNGAVDYEATQNKFLNELAAWDTRQGCDVPAITAAIHSVFDRFNAIRLNKPALMTWVICELAVPPQSHKEITARVESILKNDPNFETSKGKGTTRLCKLHTPSETPEALPVH